MNTGALQEHDKAYSNEQSMIRRGNHGWDSDMTREEQIKEATLSLEDARRRCRHDGPTHFAVALCDYWYAELQRVKDTNN